MKNVEIKPFIKTLTVPFSKSYLNRALIIGSLNPGVITIQGNSAATDVKHLIKCLKTIGLDIEESSEQIIIKNSFPACESKGASEIELDTHDSGTATRFLIPFLALGARSYRMTMSDRMLERPLNETFRILLELGVKIIREKTGILIQGPANNSNRLLIDCDKTTQEASGFLMAFSHKKVNIEFINDHHSKSYLELTQRMLGEKNNKIFNPSVDFSSISYPLALAATIGEATISNCHSVDTTQADSKFIDLLKQLGFKVNFLENGLSVKKLESYNGFTFDCSDCLDLVPTFAYLASYAQSKTELSNLKNLKFKESDRLEAILNILNEFEVNYTFSEVEDKLIINGPAPAVIPKNIKTVNDHRIVMMAYLFLRKNTGGSINNWEAVNKSFPNFFEIME